MLVFRTPSHTEPLKGHGGEKKNEMEEDNAFEFSHKCLAFPDKLCIRSQKKYFALCKRTQRHKYRSFHESIELGVLHKSKIRD